MKEKDVIGVLVYFYFIILLMFTLKEHVVIFKAARNDDQYRGKTVA